MSKFKIGDIVRFTHASINYNGALFKITHKNDYEYIGIYLSGTYKGISDNWCFKTVEETFEAVLNKPSKSYLPKWL